MDFMAMLTRNFLNTIQPNHFPEDLIGNFIEDYAAALSDGDTVRALLRYQAGFLVCAVIGILYMVLMPVIGGVLVCCRRRGCGGGRMYQMQTSRTDTYRRALYWSVLMTTVIVLLGNIYMFMSCAAFKVDVDQINGTLKDLHAYFTAVPEQFDQIDHMMNESYKVGDEINTIGPKLGREIQKRFEIKLSLAMNSVRNMTNLSHANAKNDLMILHDTLRDTLGELKEPLHVIREGIKDAISELTSIKTGVCATSATLPPNFCNTMNTYVENLTATRTATGNFEFTYIHKNLSNFQSTVDEVNWDSLLDETNSYLKNIPQNVTSDIRNVVQPMKNKLNDTKTQISQVTSGFLVSVSTNVTDTLQQLLGNINMITPEVENAEHVAKAVGVVLCCMVLLVVVCNTLGLLLGPLGLERKAILTVWSPTAHYGGNFLLMSAGFIFLFSWLLMGVVLILFVPGGNMYALVCKPWNDGQLLNIIDTPRLIELGSMLGLKSNLTLTDIYSDCQKNTSLWSTLHMDEIINLEEGLNVSQYTDKILSNVKIAPIVLLSLVEDQINKIHVMSKYINFTAYKQQINMCLSINFHEMENHLRHLIQDVSMPERIKEVLYRAATDVGGCQLKIDSPTNKAFLGTLISTTEELRSNVNKVNGTVNEVFSKVRAAEYLHNSYITQIPKTYREFLDSQLGNVTVTYAEWTNMTQQEGRCGPVARAVDSVENIVCENMVESLNTFWFSLALCLIFFIPSTICSIKLAKHYRRMTESDMYYRRMEESDKMEKSDWDVVYSIH